MGRDGQGLDAQFVPVGDPSVEILVTYMQKFMVQDYGQQIQIGVMPGAGGS